ncbi:probable protein phosphatase 2C 30 [Zingiber officinale]|uniref:probable protein phosphatase 2C 30 n=1 Tax=Zingiber officinale TaxID=94328 RepID=UPI001C4CBF42|nr:probable protein phosphatase 2C 30 [Zingiber officinale]
MAEIFHGAVSCGAEASAMASCESGPLAAIGRRMERRKFASGTETLNLDEIETSRKRRRVDESGDADAEREENSESMTGGSIETPPVASPEESEKSDRCPRYGISEFCGRRREMEDAVSVRPDFLRRDDLTLGKHHFFGVFDGHGCSHVATLCRDRMHEFVAEDVMALGLNNALPHTVWKGTIERSFARMDAETANGDGVRPSPGCRCELQPPKSDHVGSTAVVAIVSRTHIVVANCGDSRAVLCRNGVPIPLSFDHKPDREDELLRIEAAGGRVIYWDGARVFGVLAMSRAIGDNCLKPFVIPDPEVTVTERDDGDECLILASDGLWDVLSNETACNIARMCLNGGGVRGEAAETDTASRSEDDDEELGDCGGVDAACSDAALLLTKLALARQSADNISVVVVDLRNKRKRETTANSQ